MNQTTLIVPKIYHYSLEELRQIQSLRDLKTSYELAVKNLPKPKPTIIVTPGQIKQWKNQFKKYN